jgi:RsiW-degrading membrane proteinase PrsW (M82 family)
MVLSFAYLLIAFIPVLIYIFLIWATAPWKSIDIKKAFSHFIVGIISIGIVLTIHRIFPGLVKPFEWLSLSASFFIFSFLQVALIEEGSKFFSFIIGERVRGIDDVLYDKPFTTMFYCGITHLSFAFIENVNYALIYGTQVLLIRSVISMLVHFLCGLLMGYWISKGRMVTRVKKRSFSEILFIKKPHIKERIYYAIGIFTSVFIHGLYDYNIFSNGNLVSSSLIILGAVIASYLAAKDLIEN